MTAVHGLILEDLRLRGPTGCEVVLSVRAARVLERLMLRPGALVNVSDLVVAVWPDPDDEPNSAEGQVRQTLMEVRKAIAAVAGDQIMVRTERGVGTALTPRFRAAALPSSHGHLGQHEVAA